MDQKHSIELMKKYGARIVDVGIANFVLGRRAWGIVLAFM